MATFPMGWSLNGLLFEEKARVVYRTAVVVQFADSRQSAQSPHASCKTSAKTGITVSEQ
jgi:hypothetical protein